MKRLFLNVIASFTFLLSGMASAFSQETVQPVITWAKQDLIPFFISSGPYKGEGVSDKMQAFFASKLPDYEHRIIEMSFSRLLEKASQGALVCSPLLLKTPEREKSLKYSQPTKPGYDHLFVSTHDVKLENGTIDLDKFIHENNHPIIVQSGRSYGPEIDKIITHGLEHGMIEHMQISSDQLYKKITLRNQSHFIDVETGLHYYRSLMTEKDEKIKGFPIKGISSGKFAYASCSDTPDGHKVIDEINQIITDNVKSPEYREIIESWIAPERLDTFRKKYREAILN